jgi:hypothetical protein
MRFSDREKHHHNVVTHFFENEECERVEAGMKTQQDTALTTKKR